MQEPKLYCHHAFKGLSVRTNGRLAPCCTFDQKEAPDIHLNDGIANYKNSKWLREFQKDFIEGRKHKGCHDCWQIEAKQSKTTSLVGKDERVGSKRQQVEQMNPNIKKDINDTDIKFFTLVFGNTCNLACRICGPYNSSRWISLERSHGNKQSMPIYNWIGEDRYIEDIFKNIPNPIQIEFAGGETLLQDIERHLELLKLWIKNGQSGKISLNYTTNLTMFPNEGYWDIWSQFRRVTINGSMDDIGERFEYTRWPARWAVVEKIIDQYQTKCLENTHFHLAPTVSIFNLLRANDIASWSLKRGLETNWNFLYRPNWFSPAVLQPYFSEFVKIGGIIPRLIKSYSEDLHYLLPQTRIKIQEDDRRRGQDFRKIFPELRKYIDY